MAKYGDITFKGASGKEYKFEAWPWGTQFNTIGAVYFTTKRTPKSDGGGNHANVYIGQTSDLSERFDNHHKNDCFKRNGVNCICVHQDNNEESRLTKESDLIKGNKTPCNG